MTKDPLKKNGSKKSKFYLHNFLGNIAVHIHAKYRKDRMTTESVYSIWIKVDGRTDDGRLGIGWATSEISLCEHVSTRFLCITMSMSNTAFIMGYREAISITNNLWMGALAHLKTFWDNGYQWVIY